MTCFQRSRATCIAYYPSITINPTHFIIINSTFCTICACIIIRYFTCYGRGYYNIDLSNHRNLPYWTFCRFYAIYISISPNSFNFKVFSITNISAIIIESIFSFYNTPPVSIFAVQSNSTLLTIRYFIPSCSISIPTQICRGNKLY